MESLLPSEIARLVFGYLEDEDCSGAAQNFLENSPHLKECLNTYKKGKRFSSKILGLTLVELLEFLSDLVTIVRDHDKCIEWDNYDKNRVAALSKVLNFVENGNHKSSSTIGSGSRTNSRTDFIPNVSIASSNDKVPPASHNQSRITNNTNKSDNSNAIVPNSVPFSIEKVDFNGSTLGNDPFEKLCGFIKKGTYVTKKEEKELLTFLASAAEYWVQDRIVLLHLKEENDKLSQRLYILESAKKDASDNDLTYTLSEKDPSIFKTEDVKKESEPVPEEKDFKKENEEKDQELKDILNKRKSDISVDKSMNESRETEKEPVINAKNSKSGLRRNISFNTKLARRPFQF